LSQQQKIRFIWDYDTNSILVANASPSQLAVVEQLIKLYDRAPSADSISARSFQIFKLKYSRAGAVATTIKEVYRDLLSSKDKDFATAKGEEESKSAGSQTNYFYRLSGVGEEDKSKQTKVKASFEGALSVGVDEISNTIIVSAQEEWMPSIARMIEYLDENASPTTTTSVVSLGPHSSHAAIREALQGIGIAWIGNRPPKAPEEAAGQQQQPVSPKPATEGQPGQPAIAPAN
jgi:type II secretory pathway component GspD/PulD (secretin)